ncbi:unnamed protein product, partial [Dibothriocephalus latus]
DSIRKCTQPRTTICVRLSEQAVNSKDPLPDDMIHLWFELPTGWKMNCADLEGPAKPPYPGLGSAECDAQQQTLSALFDKFTDYEAENLGGRDELKRCISRTLNQTIFVENLKTSLIRAQYYYAPEQKTEIPFLLDPCKRNWIS